MLKVKPGPKMMEFSKALGISIQEAEKFINDSINDPDPRYVKLWPTAEDRKKVMMDYMLFVIDYERELNSPTGINERIKCQLKDAPHAGS